MVENVDEPLLSAPILRAFSHSLLLDTAQLSMTQGRSGANAPSWIHLEGQPTGPQRGLQLWGEESYGQVSLRLMCTREW